MDAYRQNRHVWYYIRNNTDFQLLKAKVCVAKRQNFQILINDTVMSARFDAIPEMLGRVWCG